ncbi:MAG: MarR family winged helix-turn-helix transcriptional regulator [Verrucomicrobiota bacterium]
MRASKNELSLDDGRLSTDRVALIAEFRAALAGFLERSEAGARQAGLTPQRYLLLLMVKGAPGGKERMSTGELAAKLRISANTASELVTRTERAGLVARERSRRDQRIVELRLTAEGERRLAEAIRATDDDRRALGEAFGLLARTFDSATELDARPRRRARQRT